MSHAIGSPAPIVPPRASRSRALSAVRWFHPGAALLLLVLAFVGFGRFYVHGRAYPDRPIDPSIRAVVVAHAVSMTAWLVLLCVQPALIALGRRGLHRSLGRFGALLAVSICVLGVATAVGSARTAPADFVAWGLDPRQFMAVPFVAIVAFSLFVALGIAFRRRPDVHGAMMLMGTMCAMSAAVSRIDPLNDLYVGTALERWFGPFLFTLLLGAALVLLRSALLRRLDRPLALGLAGVVAAALFTMNVATTRAWEAFAAFLID